MRQATETGVNDRLAFRLEESSCDLNLPLSNIVALLRILLICTLIVTSCFDIIENIAKLRDTLLM